MWGGMLMGGRQTKISGTLGIVTSVPLHFRGFIDGSIGSVAPGSVDGHQIIRLGEETGTTPASAVLYLGGFVSSVAPDQGWLTSIKVGSITRLGIDADVWGLTGGSPPYTLVVSWSLQPFNLAASGNTPFVLTLR